MRPSSVASPRPLLTQNVRAVANHLLLPRNGVDYTKVMDGITFSFVLKAEFR